MVIALLAMHAGGTRLDGALDVLRSVVEPTLAQPGCRTCALWLDAAHGGSVLLEQRWEAREDVERYMRSELFRRVVVALELADRPPEIAFFEVATQAGMEWAQSVRAADATRT
jgi:quinol monooxygenase YgiN